MCVTSLLCGPRADLWPFYGFLCKRFSLYIKVYQGWALQIPATFPVRSHLWFHGLFLLRNQTETLATQAIQAEVQSMASDGKGCRDLRPLIRSRCQSILKQDNEWKGELSCVTYAEFGGDWSS